MLGVYDKGKATVVETEQRLVDAETGETYTRATGSGFYVGQGGWGGPKGKPSPLELRQKDILTPIRTKSTKFPSPG